MSDCFSRGLACNTRSECSRRGCQRRALGMDPVDHMDKRLRPLDLRRSAFEAYFGRTRKSKGQQRRDSMFERREDGTYADDRTQRHWWTWQNAVAAALELP